MIHKLPEHKLPELYVSKVFKLKNGKLTLLKDVKSITGEFNIVKRTYGSFANIVYDHPGKIVCNLTNDDTVPYDFKQNNLSVGGRITNKTCQQYKIESTKSVKITTKSSNTKKSRIVKESGLIIQFQNISDKCSF